MIDRIPLARGSQVRLGASATDGFVLVDDREPRPFARHLDTGSEIGETDDGGLPLPEGGAFHVDRDLMNIGLTLQWPSREVGLGRRRAFFVLLLIARARSKGDGWIDIDELVHQAGMEANAVNTNLSRVRDRLLEAGVADYRDVFEASYRCRRLCVPAAQFVEFAG